jgi:hypothetical protein
MLDLTGVPREWLVCRGYAHRWDHGVAPLQVDNTQRPVVWASHAHCEGCGMKRWRFYVPVSCDRLGQWEYSDHAGFRRGMHMVTQTDALIEIARRDRVGEDEVKKRRTRCKAG